MHFFFTLAYYFQLSNVIASIHQKKKAIASSTRVFYYILFPIYFSYSKCPAFNSRQTKGVRGGAFQSSTYSNIF